jgi:hypothetical protein
MSGDPAVDQELYTRLEEEFPGLSEEVDDALLYLDDCAIHGAYILNYAHISINTEVIRLHIYNKFDKDIAGFNGPGTLVTWNKFIEMIREDLEE